MNRPTRDNSSALTQVFRRFRRRKPSRHPLLVVTVLTADHQQTVDVKPDRIDIVELAD
jgi:hypothetical protein